MLCCFIQYATVFGKGDMLFGFALRYQLFPTSAVSARDVRRFSRMRFAAHLLTVCDMSPYTLRLATRLFAIAICEVEGGLVSGKREKILQSSPKKGQEAS